MATRLSVLPEDVARIVWRKVFDNVITEINGGDSVPRFYSSIERGYIERRKTIIKKVDGLNKRYGKCKKKDQARDKMDKYANEYVDLKLKHYKIILMYYISRPSTSGYRVESEKQITEFLDLDRKTQMERLLPRYGRFYYHVL